MRAKRATTRTVTSRSISTEHAGGPSSRPVPFHASTSGRPPRRRLILRFMPTLTVNGRRVTADAEHTILDAARAAGIVDIPTLCWYPKLPTVGNCRICLVSVEGQAKLVPACATKGADGMGVQTESHAAVENRKGVLRLLLGRYPGDHLRNGGPAPPPHQFERYVLRYRVAPPPPRGRA